MVLSERNGVSGGLETEDSEGNQDFDTDYDTFGDTITKKEDTFCALAFSMLADLKIKILTIMMNC
jgi:hypothetical protein